MRRRVAVAAAVAVVTGACGGGGGRAVYTGPMSMTGEHVVDATYSQGVARVPGGWLFSGTNGLWRTDERLRVVRSLTPAIPADWQARGFVHIGDVDVVGRYVYAPFEQGDYSKGQQANARYDLATLRFVDAVVVSQHENSFVTVDPATMTAYSMDRFDGDSLLRYDVRGWKPLPPLNLSMHLIHTQGADIAGGAVWISTSDEHNDVYRVDIKTGRVDALGSMGHATAEGEGIDATPLSSGLLHTLTVVPRNTAWFDHFKARKV